jgi:hypothetical protein
MKTFM